MFVFIGECDLGKWVWFAYPDASVGILDRGDKVGMGSLGRDKS
jgi:hypothetical protein